MNVYQNGWVEFSSPLNQGTQVYVNGSGGFTANLLADQNFMVEAFEQSPGAESIFNLPVGVLEQDESYNVVMPVSTLTVLVRDASGNPVTGGYVYFQSSSISPLPGIPGSDGQAYFGGGSLNTSGNESLIVPNGITLQGLAIHLNDGLVLPFTLPAITADEHVFLIFRLGKVFIDEPPVVTGTPDQAPNANGWYNAPVTITWTSTSPAGSPGPPTTPAPTTVSSEGANQVITSGPSCDPAGDCAVGTVTGINIDMTPPSVSVTGVTSEPRTPRPRPRDAPHRTPCPGYATSATISVTNSGTKPHGHVQRRHRQGRRRAAPVSVSYLGDPVRLDHGLAQRLQWQPHLRRRSGLPVR